MKSPPFAYVRAGSLPEALDLLARHGDRSRILAGGQTLLATLNMRLSDPALLIDINRLEELKGITLQPSPAHEDRVRIAALVTHAEIEQSSLVARHLPMVTQAAPHIGHRAIRNRGTFGGSIAFADPAAEWPACALALDATVVLLSVRGERRVAAADFFQGLYTTCAEGDEIVAACEFPLGRTGQQQDFSEFARRHGDYAVAGLAASAIRAGASGGTAQAAAGAAGNAAGDRAAGAAAQSGLDEVRLALFGIADRPVRARRAEALLSRTPIGDDVLRAAGASLAEEIEIVSDLTHGKATKRHLAEVLIHRAIRRILGAA